MNCEKMHIFEDDMALPTFMDSAFEEPNTFAMAVGLF